MEYQYRYPVSRVVLEIPAGKLDSEQEDVLEAAKRELQEETGYSADEWINIGDYMPAPAYSNERVTMFIARGLHMGERHLDEGEFLDIKRIAAVFNTTLSEIIREALNAYLPGKKEAPYYRLTANAEPASVEESSEILDAVESLSDEDMAIVHTRKFQI